jgi:hypothetical protein
MTIYETRRERGACNPGLILVSVSVQKLIHAHRECSACAHSLERRGNCEHIPKTKYQNAAALKYITSRRVRKCKQNSYNILRTNGYEIDKEILFSAAKVQVENQELKICSTKKRLEPGSKKLY